MAKTQASTTTRSSKVTWPGVFSVCLLFLFSPTAAANGHRRSEGVPPESDNHLNVQDFVGDAVRVSPASACPRILPDKMKNPFMSLTTPLAVRDYELAGCWTGKLEGKNFVLTEYFSPYAGGGLAIQYDGHLVGRVASGSGKPSIIRFTGQFVCDMENAGAHYVAVNLMTGAVMEDRKAQKVCPPQAMSGYVLGLRDRRIPVHASGD